MHQLEERLRSRFESGFITDIQAPDLELRVAILKRKAQSLGINVPNDVLMYLGENIKENVRQIEGAYENAKKHMEIFCSIGKAE
jgi:chromosomal replication initiator protein